jgi:crossover junction endodeoxyribonuclease RusA
MCFELPWPDKRLSPNARQHWVAKSRAIKTARITAAWMAQIERVDLPITADSITATVTFFPPDSRRRDTDNMLASCKAYFDGIAPVIGMDDSRWDFVLKRGEVRKGGAVRVQITSGTAS